MTELSIDLRSSFKAELGIDLNDIANVARGISQALDLATDLQKSNEILIDVDRRIVIEPPPKVYRLVKTLQIVGEQFELISLPLQERARWLNHSANERGSL